MSSLTVKMPDGSTHELHRLLSDANHKQREGKALVNYGASAGYIGSRMRVMKDTGEWLPRDNAVDKDATAAEKKAMLETVEQGLKEGGLGVGFGFNYTPRAMHGELLEVFQFASQWQRPSFIHMRYGFNGDPGIAVSLLAIAGTFALLWYQRRVIARTGSVAIKTDNVHYQ